MAVRDNDDPIWKQIVFNEVLWVVIVIVLILVAAFHLATSSSDEEESGGRPHPTTHRFV